MQTSWGTFFIMLGTVLLLGAITGAGITYGICRGHIGQLDSELAAGRADLARVTEQYNTVAGQLETVRIRLDSILGGVRAASAIVDRISEQSDSAIETVRNVIKNLARLKTILRDMANG